MMQKIKPKNPDFSKLCVPVYAVDEGGRHFRARNRLTP